MFLYNGVDANTGNGYFGGLQFDQSTGRAQFYPRPLSLYSEAGTQWREASGRGTIFALTLSRVSPPALAARTVREDPDERFLAQVAATLEAIAAGERVRVLAQAALSQNGLQARQHISGYSDSHGRTLMRLGYPTKPAARFRRSLIASPRPVCGIGATAMARGPVLSAERR